MDRRYNFYNLEASFRSSLLAGNENNSNSLVKNYVSDLRHFLGWFFFRLKVLGIELNQEEITNSTQVTSQINLSRFEEYVDYLRENRIPTKTINRRLSALRKFCSFCVNQGWLKDNPAKKIKNVSTRPDSGRLLDSYREDLQSKGLEKPQIQAIVADIKEFISLIS